MQRRPRVESGPERWESCGHMRASSRPDQDNQMARGDDLFGIHMRRQDHQSTHGPKTIPWECFRPSTTVHTVRTHGPLSLGCGPSSASLCARAPLPRPPQTPPVIVAVLGASRDLPRPPGISNNLPHLCTLGLSNGTIRLSASPCRVVALRFPCRFPFGFLLGDI